VIVNRERERDDDWRNSQLETIYFHCPIKDYFKKKNIQFIKLSDDGKRVLINGKENIPGMRELIFSDINVREWIQNNNNNSLTLSELENIQRVPDKENQPRLLTVHKPFTTKLYEFYQTPTFWIIAGIIGVIDLIYLYFYFFEREKLKASLKKNTLLKIFTYLLAIASVVILVIPIIFLLAGAGSNKCKRCGKLKETNCHC
jgi:hypothetical protein